MLLLVLFSVLGLTSSLPLDAWGNVAVEYLSKYGYLEERIQSLNPEEIPIGTMSEAISKFQDFFRLKVTGVLDDETKLMMKTPRCGNKDLNPGEDKRRRRRKRRYVHEVSGIWGMKNITYSFDLKSIPTHATMSKQMFLDEIERAYQMWADVTPLSFTRVSSADVAVMNMMFVKKEHGDARPFDGPEGQYAHSFIPMFGGDTHYDEEDKFTAYTHRGINFLQITAHELGHALGLDHSRENDAIMAAGYRGYVPNFKLGDDDIKGIQSLYGKGSKNPASKKKYETGQRKADPELCKDTAIDAIFIDESENLHVFKGTKYYLFDDKGMLPGYPKVVQSMWKEVPKKIDAVVISGSTTMFFCGTQIYLYTGTRLIIKGPIKKQFRGLPNNLDTAYTYHNFIVGIKDSKVFLYNMETRSFFKTIDRPQYPGSMKKVTSAVVSKYTLSLFSGDKFFVVHPTEFMILRQFPAYPWSNGPMWFGCDE